MTRGGFVYIITNKNRTVLYIGVTANLKERIYQHKTKQYPKSFSAKYNCDELVYYLGFHFIEDAIVEEKRLKAGSRKSKEDLINEFNPNWDDLFDSIDFF